MKLTRRALCLGLLTVPVSAFAQQVPAPPPPPPPLIDDDGREYRVCPQCGNNMYKQGRMWVCENCGYSYVE